MNIALRLQVAREYLELLVKHRGEPKAAMLAIRKKWPMARSTILGYVAELRKK